MWVNLSRLRLDAGAQLLEGARCLAFEVSCFGPARVPSSQTANRVKKPQTVGRLRASSWPVGSPAAPMPGAVAPVRRHPPHAGSIAFVIRKRLVDCDFGHVETPPCTRRDTTPRVLLRLLS